MRRFADIQYLNDRSKHFQKIRKIEIFQVDPGFTEGNVTQPSDTSTMLVWLFENSMRNCATCVVATQCLKFGLQSAIFRVCLDYQT